MESIFAATNPGHADTLFRGAPPGSLLARVATIAARLRSFKAVCVLWRRFVFEVRNRLDSGVQLPAVDPVVALQSALLHQKLQVVQACLMPAVVTPAAALGLQGVIVEPQRLRAKP